MRLAGLHRVFALAGALPPVLFTVAVTVLTVLEYDFLTALGWDPVRRSGAGWPSVLALGDLGWVAVTTFASCGLLGVAFAAGLYRALEHTTWSMVGTAFLAALAVAVGLEAFPTDPPGSTAPATWHGEIHDRVYPAVVVCSIAAPLFLAAALWSDRRWRRYGSYSLGTAAFLLAALALQAHAAYAQLVEYFFFGALLLWIELLAIRLWTLAPDRGQVL